MLARLESAVNEIKRFTADASHELRNPVSFVRTTAELALRNREADPASRRAFEDIVAECGKANRLLKDMLTLARADSRQFPARVRTGRPGGGAPRLRPEGARFWPRNAATR